VPSLLDGSHDGHVLEQLSEEDLPCACIAHMRVHIAEELKFVVNL